MKFFIGILVLWIILVTIMPIAAFTIGVIGANCNGSEEGICKIGTLLDEPDYFRGHEYEGR